MFRLDLNFLMVPQALYDALLVCAGLLAPMGLAVALLRRRKRPLPWLALGLAAAALLALLTTGRIVGHRMVGGQTDSVRSQAAMSCTCGFSLQARASASASADRGAPSSSPCSSTGSSASSASE